MKHFLTVPIANLLPHQGEMIWVDKVLTYDDESVTASVIVRSDSLFGGESVPAWVGIEYMAQTVGLYAGIQALRAGDPVRPGFLLGARRFMSSVSTFSVGETLTVNAVRVLHDERLWVFECRITGDRVTVEALLNVYQTAAEEQLQNDE